MFLTSIFDECDPKTEYRLWKKPTKDFKITFEPALAFSALKKSEQNGKITGFVRYFLIHQNLLCYSYQRSFNKIRGILDLKWARVVIKQISDEERGNEIYEVKFIKNFKFTSIYLDSEEGVNILRNKISSLCVMTDMSQRLNFMEYFASGGYSKVIFSQNKK